MTSMSKAMHEPYEDAMSSANGTQPGPSANSLSSLKATSSRSSPPSTRPSPLCIWPQPGKMPSAPSARFRAGTLPLRYVRDELRLMTVSEVEGVNMLLPRIAELDITPLVLPKETIRHCLRRVKGEPLQEHPFSLLARTAPVLQRLVLRMSRYELRVVDFSAADFFDADAPQLREVLLRIWPVPWHSRLLRNLVSLNIAVPYWMPGHVSTWGMPTCARVLDILKACSSTLEALHLDFGRRPFIADTEPVPACTELRIALPRLTIFSLHMSVVDFLALFDRIGAPREAALHATLWYEPQAKDPGAYDSDPRALVSAYEQHAASRIAAGTPFTHLHIDTNTTVVPDPRKVELTLSPGPTPHPNPDRNLDPPSTPSTATSTLRIVFPSNIVGSAPTEAGWLASFFHTVPLGTITDLTVNVQNARSAYWDSTAWFGARTMPRVYRLQICAIKPVLARSWLPGDSKFETVQCLVHGDGDADGSAPATVPFPQLETLAVDMQRVRTGAEEQPQALALIVQQRRAAIGLDDLEVSVTAGSA
ncbi:hypothetical protein EVG20_g6522 [Dentipellis fragilis]|uniref:F-box domain-containing protein n=1 Tax=Dentipellis fragilis TaxID=205917 RepID=A0A4Y9YMJ5_9AGAM|nr:hypothetical protein EVG20_g6522 [Dentipellis fragilis]